LVNHQQREPLAARFGAGTASSSDGQFLQAGGPGRSQQPGFKAYTHLSDRYGPFFTKLIAATASEALHVLDALLYHQSEADYHVLIRADEAATLAPDFPTSRTGERVSFAIRCIGCIGSHKGRAKWNLGSAKRHSPSGLGVEA